jgi:Rubrerythrin
MVKKQLKDLTAQEILALAIQSEEKDGRIYADLAQRIRKDYPATAQSLQAIRAEEDGHRHRLISRNTTGRIERPSRIRSTSLSEFGEWASLLK